MRKLFVAHLAAVFGLIAASYDASGGLGVGSSFVHQENRTFDFHIAYPKYWRFTSERVSQSLSSWKLTNLGTAPAGLESSIDVVFTSALDVAGAEELLAAIKSAESPDIEWTPLTLPFVGWTSGDIGSGGISTHSIDYYLSERNLVIRLESIVHVEGSGAQDVLHIVKSIDRASGPPRITAIAADHGRVYRVGDEACITIEVDDLKSSFDGRGVPRVEIRGQRPYARFRTTKWIPQSNWFQVCAEVLPSFKSDSLELDLLKISNNRGQIVLCRPSSGGKSLSCENSDGTDPYEIPVTFPRVNNPNPDVHGPRINDVHFDEHRRELIVSASDASGIMGGRVVPAVQVVGLGSFSQLSAKQMSWLLYPEHLVGRKPLSVATELYRGWLTINSILVFDTNGIPTMLRQPNGDCQNSTRNDPHFYESVQETGECQQTTIPIITFLNR